jgi:hypothetical protein
VREATSEPQQKQHRQNPTPTNEPEQQQQQTSHHTTTREVVLKEPETNTKHFGSDGGKLDRHKTTGAGSDNGGAEGKRCSSHHHRALLHLKVHIWMDSEWIVSFLSRER